MNIFVLDKNPYVAAQLHNDKHVVKMILETAQMLCSVHHMINIDDEKYRESIPYKLAHKNHPCSVWARECLENYNWLCDLGIALGKEYRHRYGMDKYHKSLDVIMWAYINKPNIPLKGDVTPFALAMPDECKTDDPVESYKNYYRMYKQHWEKKDKKTGEIKEIAHTWTKREKPEFMLLAG
jgi:hypothetical protein